MPSPSEAAKPTPNVEAPTHTQPSPGKLKALWMRIPFRYKLVGAFFLVIALGIVSIYFVNNYNLIQQFSKFNSERFNQRAEQLAPVLLYYYEQTGSWDDLLAEFAQPPSAPGAGRRILSLSREQLFLFEFLRVEEIIIADASATVIFDFGQMLLGQQLPQAVLNQGFPLVYEDQTVGTLLSGVALERFTPLAQQFLRSLNRSTLIAGLGALAVSLLLITLLIRHLARPLNAMTRAAEQIAAGKLGHQVEVTSQDELGQLARSFNAMSAKLQASEHLRQQMITDVAHELRTPVSVIQGGMEALVDGVYSPDQETFHSLLEETQRLSRLIDELRELSLLDAGELRLVKRDTNLSALSGQLVKAFQPHAEAAGIALCYQDAGAPVQLPADSDRIAQVLRNLLSNALHYTPQGGRVEVRLEQRGGQAVCTVSDTGPGLSAEEQARVFDRFWRNDLSRARHSGGSGLGLSIAKRLVEAHGGALWVRSTPGQGSTFGFGLPMMA